MPLKLTASSPTPPPLPETIQKLRPWLLSIGICLVLMPLAQGYLAIQPYMALAPFMPTEMIVDQILDSMKWGHSALIAGGSMLVSGVLLIVNQRKSGWFFGAIGLGFSVIWTLELLLFTIVSLAKSPDQFGPMMEIGIELMAMTYYLPVVFFVLQCVFLIFLVRRSVRNAMQVGRKHLLIAAGFLLILLIDSHLSLAFTFLMYQ